MQGGVGKPGTRRECRRARLTRQVRRGRLRDVTPQAGREPGTEPAGGQGDVTAEPQTGVSGKGGAFQGPTKPSERPGSRGCGAVRAELAELLNVT